LKAGGGKPFRKYFGGEKKRGDEGGLPLLRVHGWEHRENGGNDVSEWAVREKGGVGDTVCAMESEDENLSAFFYARKTEGGLKRRVEGKGKCTAKTNRRRLSPIAGGRKIELTHWDDYRWKEVALRLTGNVQDRVVKRLGAGERSSTRKYRRTFVFGKWEKCFSQWG